ncbi:MAG: hypothetical protein ACRD0H_08125 [Actinomycetes bacterium]
MSRPPAPKTAASCQDCLSWGLLTSGCCMACRSFSYTHEPGECAACRRAVPLKKGYCRLCWIQASLEAKGQVTVLEPFLREIRHHQLSFAGMQRWGARKSGQRIGKQGRRGPPPRPQAQPAPAPPTWRQLPLPLEVRRDFTRFDRRRDADPANRWLLQARSTAAAIGERRGWSQRLAKEVDRALVILLSRHADGEQIRYSELFPALRRRGLSVERTVEILDALQLLDDDRVPSFQSWLQRVVAGLAPGISADVEDWLRTLHDGGPRSRPRAPETVQVALRAVHPTLIGWSSRYHHLREVTRDDILAVADSLKGTSRSQILSRLKSLFGHCRKKGSIFKDPTSRIRIGAHPQTMIQPLPPEDFQDATQHATTPLARLLVALAVVHAARTGAIRDLRLDDIDLGNHRLTIAGRPRPLDDLTRQMILGWLAYRQKRWPNSANPHLIVNQQTAMEHGPMSKVSITAVFRGRHATIERLRANRQLEEALTFGPDPLHLAAVFGLDTKTAIRYAESARQLLITAAEEQDPFSSPPTQGPDLSMQGEDS